jgi:hypothetical protein
MLELGTVPSWHRAEASDARRFLLKENSKKTLSIRSVLG